MKYYYMINGKLMWATSKMPKIIDNIQSSESIDNYLIVWHSSLQHCSITDVEFQKILAYCYSQNPNFNNPIEVTDIVEESIKKCDCCIIDCLPTRCLNPKVTLVFKQPKSEANEADLIKYLDECIEACDMNISVFKSKEMKTSYLCSDAMKTAYSNVKTFIETNETILQPLTALDELKKSE